MNFLRQTPRPLAPFDPQQILWAALFGDFRTRENEWKIYAGGWIVPAGAKLGIKVAFALLWGARGCQRLARSGVGDLDELGVASAEYGL